MVYKFINERAGSGISINEQLAKELYKPEIKKLKRKKLFAKFKDNIWAANLVEMEPLSSKNKNVKIYYV